MLVVDKELAKQTVNLINELALSDPNGKYTFMTFCQENNLTSDADKELRNGNFFICCPFHKESKPSLGINEDRRVWNCLGCGKHGNFIDFVKDYRNEVYGSDISFYQQVNEFLKADPILQSKLGASSIYKQEKPQEAFKGASYRKFKIQSSKPKTYLELATLMQSKKCSKDIIIFALLQMQNGVPVENVYDNVMSGDFTSSAAKENKPSYDLTQMMEDTTENNPKKLEV